MQQLSCLKGLYNIPCCTSTVSICSYKNNLWWKNSTIQLYHHSLIFFFQGISILYWTELQVALFFYTLSHGVTQLQDSTVMEQSESLNEKCNHSLLGSKCGKKLHRLILNRQLCSHTESCSWVEGLGQEKSCSWVKSWGQKQGDIHLISWSRKSGAGNLVPQSITEINFWA